MKRSALMLAMTMALSIGLASAIKHDGQVDDSAAACVTFAKLAARHHPSRLPDVDREGTERRAFQLCLGDPVAFKRLFRRVA